MNELDRYRQEIAPHASESLEALALLRVLAIASPADYDFAGNMVKHVKAQLNALDSRRKEITQPLLQAKRSVDDLFAPVIKNLEESERVLKSKIGAYVASQERARVRAMQASALEYQAGGTPTLVIPEPARTQGVTVKELWDYEVTDPTLVPRDLCSPDRLLILSRIQGKGPNDPPETIPGIRLFLGTSVVVRK